ncbi:hypothetical protein BpHYR1_051705 [Brachionus plicatilis]|uniref:Uncharacterized protein n=1 Tax=Brachionus plicatilis TaxID=10195 RepID=A0A3M7SI13_BRAPC|nr:hypothetical protein BpHYR1_051705 [Brachionus plicatilis]
MQNTRSRERSAPFDFIIELLYYQDSLEWIYLLIPLKLFLIFNEITIRELNERLKHLLYQFKKSNNFFYIYVFFPSPNLTIHFLDKKL